MKRLLTLLFVTILVGCADREGRCQCEAITFGGQPSTAYLRSNADDTFQSGTLTVVGNISSSSNIITTGDFIIDAANDLTITDGIIQEAGNLDIWRLNGGRIAFKSTGTELYAISTGAIKLEVRNSNVQSRTNLFVWGTLEVTNKVEISAPVTGTSSGHLLAVGGDVFVEDTIDYGYNQQFSVAAGATTTVPTTVGLKEGMHWVKYKAMARATNNAVAIAAFYEKTVAFHTQSGTARALTTSTLSSEEDNAIWDITHSISGGTNFQIVASGSSTNATRWTVVLEEWAESDQPTYF